MLLQTTRPRKRVLTPILALILCWAVCGLHRAEAAPKEPPSVIKRIIPPSSLSAWDMDAPAAFEHYLDLMRSSASLQDEVLAHSYFLYTLYKRVPDVDRAELLKKYIDAVDRSIREAREREDSCSYPD